MKRNKIQTTPLMERLQQLMEALVGEKDSTPTEQLTQFAAKCHLSQGTLISIMRDGKRPRIDTFEKICRGTGVCAEWLLFGDSRRAFNLDGKKKKEGILQQTKTFVDMLNKDHFKGN